MSDMKANWKDYRKA